MMNPRPRPAPEGAHLDWGRFAIVFPVVTHLYLPGFLIPLSANLTVSEGHTLVKLAIGPGGPPVPITALSIYLSCHTKTLRSLHLGHLLPNPPGDFELLARVLARCSRMESFKCEWDIRRAHDQHSSQAIASRSDAAFLEAMKGPWQKSLKVSSYLLVFSDRRNSTSR